MVTFEVIKIKNATTCLFSDRDGVSGRKSSEDKIVARKETTNLKKIVIYVKMRVLFKNSKKGKHHSKHFKYSKKLLIKLKYHGRLL